MAGERTARKANPGESIDAFMQRRRQETTGGKTGARAAAHQAYGLAIRNGHDLDLKQPSDLASHRANAPAPATGLRAKGLPAKRWSIGHPGFAESLIPVWGSGREAIADWQEGDRLGAVLNTALAFSDLSLAEDVVKAVGKSGLYALHGPLLADAKKLTYPKWKRKFPIKKKDTSWKAVSQFMHDPENWGGEQLLHAEHDGHHWLIPNNGWGKAVPDWIKNHPLNINELEQVTHQRIHRQFKGLPRFDPVKRTWVGTPAWVKVLVGDAAGHTAGELEKREKHR